MALVSKARDLLLFVLKNRQNRGNSLDQFSLLEPQTDHTNRQRLR